VTNHSSLNNSVSKSSHKIPLRIVLIVPFFLQVIATIGVVGWLSYRNSQKAVNSVADQLRDEISNRIEQNVHHLVESPYRIIESYEAALSQNCINLEDKEKFIPHLMASLVLLNH